MSDETKDKENIGNDSLNTTGSENLSAAENDNATGNEDLNAAVDTTGSPRYR